MSVTKVGPNAALVATVIDLQRGFAAFAKPPGKGLSSARVNFLWGFANLVVGWVLVARVGAFDPRDAWHVAALGVGSLGIGAHCAHHFGRFHGGNTPERP
jgi:hypothetical protein